MSRILYSLGSIGIIHNGCFLLSVNWRKLDFEEKRGSTDHLWPVKLVHLFKKCLVAEVHYWALLWAISIHFTPHNQFWKIHYAIIPSCILIWLLFQVLFWWKFCIQTRRTHSHLSLTLRNPVLDGFCKSVRTRSLFKDWNLFCIITDFILFTAV